MYPYLDPTNFHPAKCMVSQAHEFIISDTITLTNFIYLSGFSMHGLSNQLQAFIFSLSSEAVNPTVWYPFLFGHSIGTQIQ